MKIRIIEEFGWYQNLVGHEFEVQSESRKGGKGKYVVRLKGEQRQYMNDYPYGWVDKEHCEAI